MRGTALRQGWIPPRVAAHRPESMLWNGAPMDDARNGPRRAAAGRCDAIRAHLALWHQPRGQQKRLIWAVWTLRLRR